MIVWRRLAASAALVLSPALTMAADVSIYGSANVELGSYQDQRPEAEQTDDFKTLRLEDNTRGRFGIKASEDLGRGVSSLARFEWEVSTTTNTSPAAPEDSNVSLTGRMSYVGVAGKLGSALAGNLMSPYKYTGGVKYDPFVTTALEARGNGGMTGGPLGHEDFLKKTVGYELPKGLLSGSVAYGVEEDDNVLALDLLLKKGGWEVFVAYVDSGNRTALVDPTDSASGQPLDYRAAKVGGQFLSESGAHRVSLQYEYVEDGFNSVEVVKPSVWFLGYQFKYNKAILAAQVGRSSKDSATIKKTDYGVLGAIYRFTPDTRIYTGYRYSKDIDAVFTFGLRKDFRS